MFLIKRIVAALRHANQLARERMGRLLGPALVYGGSSALSRAIPFLLMPIMTRVLTPTDYGAVAMFGLTVSVLNALTGLNTQYSIIVRYTQGNTNMPQYVSTCLVIIAVSVLCLLALVGLFGPWLSRWAEIPSVWIMVAVVVSAAQITTSVLLSLWQARGRATAYGAMEFSRTVLEALFSLTLVVGLGMAWHGRVLGQTLTALSAALFALYFLQRKGHLGLPVRWDYAKAALAYGLPLIPHAIGSLVLGLIDRAMVANMLSLHAAGLYAVALQLATILNLAAYAFNQAYQPWLYARLKEDQPSMKIKIVRATYQYFVLITLLALAMGLLAPPILGVLVGERFQQAAPIVIFLALGYAFVGMYYMVGGYIFYTGQTGKLAWITISAGLCNLIGNLYLIPKYGASGAAMAFAFAQCFTFVLTWILSQRVYAMPWLLALKQRA